MGGRTLRAIRYVTYGIQAFVLFLLILVLVGAVIRGAWALGVFGVISCSLGGFWFMNALSDRRAKAGPPDPPSKSS